MKKLLNKFAALAAAALVLGFFAGCGDSGQNSQSGSDIEISSSEGTSSTEKDNTASQDSDKKELTTLKVLCTDNTTTGADLADRENFSVWHTLEDHLAERGIAVELGIVNSDQYQVIIQTRLASGTDLPDYMGIKELDGTTVLNLANQGMFLPINEILEHSDGAARDFFDEEAAFAKGLLTTSDGNMYWVPYVVQRITYEGKPQSTCVAMTIRQDWLDMVEMDVPTTAEEFAAVCKAFRDKDVNGFRDSRRGDSIRRLQLLQWYYLRNQL